MAPIPHFEPSYLAAKNCSWSATARFYTNMDAKLGSPIPSIIWDALNDVLEASTLRLANEIAKTLDRSAQPLISLIRQQKVRPHVVELSDDPREIDARCDYRCQRPDALGYIQECGQPIFWEGNVKRCPKHLYLPPAPPTPSIMTKVQRTTGTEQPLYIIVEDNTLYGPDFNFRGRDEPHNNRIILFEVEEEDESA